MKKGYTNISVSKNVHEIFLIYCLYNDIFMVKFFVMSENFLKFTYELNIEKYLLLFKVLP